MSLADHRSAARAVTPSSVPARRLDLVSRRHVDYGRMSSAICQA